MPKVDKFRVSDFARLIADDVVNGTGIQGNTQTKRHSYSSKLFATNTATPWQTPSRMRIIRVRNRVANSQPRQVSSDDLVRGQVDRTLVRIALFVSLPFNKNDGRTADIDPVDQGRSKPGK
jgi:hypothetical protein